jgi:hypothetical protein
MGTSGGTTTTSSGTSTIRYAPYIESHHQTFLSETSAYVDSATNAAPFNDFSEIPVDVGFFGAGYVLASFPSAFDVYGKFVAGLDIEAMWNQVYNSTVESPVVNNLIQAHSAFLSDELDTTVLPKYQLGMRDINAVMTSSYVIGKGLLMDQMEKNLNKFATETKFKMIDVAQNRWKMHLVWNQDVATKYAGLIKDYFTVKQNMTAFNFDMLSRQALWPLLVRDYERANLGALQGALTNQSSNTSTQKGNDSGLGTVMSLVSMAAMIYSFS